MASNNTVELKYTVTTVWRGWLTTQNKCRGLNRHQTRLNAGSKCFTGNKRPGVYTDKYSMCVCPVSTPEAITNR